MNLLRKRESGPIVPEIARRIGPIHGDWREKRFPVIFFVI